MNGIDYSIAAGDFVEAARIYREMGCVIVKDLVSPALVQRVQSRMIDALRAYAGWDGDILPGGLVSVGPDNYFDLARSIERIVSAGMADEEFERVLHGPVVNRLIRNLIGDEVFVHPQKVPRILPPGDCPWLRPAGIHQDFPELQGSERQITVWFPLHDVDGTTGVLPVYPGMHRQGVLPLTLAENPSGWAISEELLPRAYLASMRAGDAIVFNTFTPHGGSVNTSGNLRMSIECRFQPLGDQISESAFELPGYSFGWDEIYRDWSTLGYYWEGRRPEVVPYDRRWEEWRERESIRMGRLALPEAHQALRLTMQWSRDAGTRAEAREILASGYGEGQPG
ncbi:phytanoyl-CoA dioxygenase family protein [Nocardia sp. CA-290969]|uniref:phytanoyl-CoA dioxygenase family protein n=1 Tax=Nocardia sp. CA-290969 TaxID=3239986 RepID=UPI003D8F2B06